MEDFLRGLAQILIRILLHLPHDQFLVERATVDTDAHRLVMIDGYLTEGREILVPALATAHIARVDAELVQGSSTLRNLGQQDVTVVVEIPDQGHFATDVDQPALDLADRLRSLFVVDRDTHQLRAGLCQLSTLRGCRLDIRCIRIRHGLDNDGRTPTDPQ